MLAQSERYGARVALFGRKINQAESQLDFIALMRAVADGNMTAREAVKAYHARLAERGIPPLRDFESDDRITEQVLTEGAT